MAKPEPPRRQMTLAESLFCDYLIRTERGESVDFDALCAAHPAAASDLHLLRHERRRMQQALGDLRLRRGEMRTPRRQDRYEVGPEIAHGGMSTIVAATDKNLGRRTAMKTVPRPRDLSNPIALLWRERCSSRLVNEASLLGQLQHPSILPLHHVGTTADGEVFFTMPLVTGQSFADVIASLHAANGQDTLAGSVQVLLRVCEAMAYAHERGVIHRDLKPANIMVGRQGQVYVMDWGLAKARNRRDQETPGSWPSARSLEGARLTIDGEVLGTPAYMPPEQAHGDAERVDERADVYGAGAMLYHLLAGRPPYVDGIEPSPQAILARVRRGPPAPLGTAAGRAPVELIAIADRAMAREPSARYPSMHALANDLRAFLEVRPVSAHRTGTWSELRSWLRRNRSLGASLAGAVLIVLIAVTILAARQVQFLGEMRARTERLARSRDAARDAAAAAAAQEQDLLELSDLKLLETLRQQMGALTPPNPGKIAGLEQWLADADQLLGRAPSHRATLAALRTRARAWTDAERADDRLRATVEDALRRERTERDQGYARARAVATDRGLWCEVEERARTIAALEGELPAAVPIVFDRAEDQWHHDVLGRLVSELASFAQHEHVLMTKRLEHARTVRERSITGAEARARWQAAIADVADRTSSPHYAGLQLRPQLGLLPIGRDPGSQLWEFWHLQTGAEPERDAASGQLRIEDGTGIVLVLLPPGSLRHPTRRVRLDPVFLSKYEMTQGQWLRATGENPSVMCPERNDWSGEPITLAHPVGFVSWPEADRVMRELGLALQTWAQGEYGCRAGTTTKWWTGDDLKSLEGAGNFADQANLRLGIGEPSWSYAPWDDGCASIARVGSYRPNPFGLYDVHGNAAEWCADSTVNLPARDGDGGRFEAQETGRRVSRDSASRILETRSEAASAYDTPLRFPTGGVRPARAIEE